ncbi:MAG: hypothetical protein Q8L80_07950 [Gallionella sp.]|nr:hypothetical protein [Gallionella sp.]MDP1941257.1 hypothetical protein [Gallionella sp.]
MNTQRTKQPTSFEAQFNRVFAANDKPIRTVTRIYSDGARLVGTERPNEIPVRIKSEVEK